MENGTDHEGAPPWVSLFSLSGYIAYRGQRSRRVKRDGTLRESCTVAKELKARCVLVGYSTEVCFV